MSADVLYNPDQTGSVSRSLADKLFDVISVKDFGAAGDGVTDDTAAFQAAIAYSQSNPSGNHMINGAIFIPNGSYLISATLDLTAGEFTGASLIGESRDGTILVSALTGTDPLIQCTGGSGSPSNVHICDLTLTPPTTSYAGTGICLNSIDAVYVERCKIDYFNYGIWLCNNTPNGFTEINFFRDIWVSDCMNCIRMEQGSSSSPSFHGNSFANVCGNVYVRDGTPQIWLNLVSGYWYNFTMGFHIWTVGSAVAINADADAPSGFGSIQIEPQADPDTGDPGPGQFTGSGILWWKGSLDVNGSINDLTAGLSDGNPNIACDNYFKSGPFTNPNMPVGTGASSVPRPAATSGVAGPNGQLPLLFSMTGANISSIGTASYSGWDGNGFWVVGVGYNGSLANCAPGFYFKFDGSYMTSFADSCSLQVNGQPAGNQLLLQSNGLHRGNMGLFASDTVPAGTTTPITVPIGYPDPSVAQNVYFRLIGANYEYRYVFLINQNCFGNPGYLTVVATLWEFGGPAPTDFAVDEWGNLVFSANVDQDLTYVARAVGIGAY